MEINGDPPPLWPQLSSSSMHRRRSPPSPLFTLPVLIILLPTIALLLFFFVLPPFLSATTQVLRTHSVKKSWDSLNVFLVIFAILCGIFARRNDDGSSGEDDNGGRSGSIDVDSKASRSVSQPWFEDPDKKIYEDVPVKAMSRLRRNSSSYPDLRQEPPLETADDRFRFLDDFELNKYRSPASDYAHHVLRRTRSDFVESEAKEIPVDTFVLRSSPLSPSPPTPPPKSPVTKPPIPPPPPGLRQTPRRTYKTIGQKEKVRQTDTEFSVIKDSSPPPPPPPPPQPPAPPVQTTHRSEEKDGKRERRKSNATKEIKMVLASLYNQRKRKRKQKRRNNNHSEETPHFQSEPHAYDYSTMPPPSPPPPPPPPLPPPPSVFHNLFKKGSKSKKIHSVPIPPPPPPPPAFSWPKLSSKGKSKVPSPPPAPPTPPPETSRRRTRSSACRPPLPTKAKISYDETLNSGAQSPLIPMPPPPPPPLKMAEPKFVSRGDFFKFRSADSSRCGSPEPGDMEVSSNKEDLEPTIVTDDGGGPSVFCPSPDVNIKAETFIARLRDEWRLEKMNSIREKRKI